MAEKDVSFVIRVQDETAQTIKRFESNVIRTVGAITAAFATLKFTLFPIQAAADFERELKNVQKTTEFTDEEIRQLSKSLLGMSTRLGTAATDLAAISAIAGQLGLGKQGKAAVEAFTESVAKASVTLDLSVEKAGEFGAQLAAVFNVPIASVEKIFSLLNEVSNNSVATAGELSDIMKRIGNTANLTITQVAALAGYARELGVPVEQAGTTFVNAFINLQTKVKVVTKLLQISSEEWGRRLRADPLEALKDVARALDRITDQSKQAELVDELFGSGRQFSALQKVVVDAGNDFERLNMLLQKGTQAFITGQSSAKEYANIMEALVKQFDKLKQAFNNLAIKAGEKALEPLVRAFRNLTEVLEGPGALAAVESLSRGIALLVSSIVDLVKWVGEVSPSLDQLLAILKLLIAVKAAQWFFALGTAILSIGNTVAGYLLGPLSRYITAVSQIGPATSTAMAQAGAAATNFQTTLIRVVAAVGITLRQLNASMTGMVGAIQSLVVIAEQGAAAAASAAASATAAAAAAAAAQRNAAASNITSAFGKSLGTVGVGAAAADSFLNTAAKANAAAIAANTLRDASEAAARNGKELLNTTKSVQATLQNSTRSVRIFSSVMGGVGSVVTGLGGVLKNIFAGITRFLFGPLGLLITTLVIAFPEQAKAAWDSVWGFIKAGATSVSGWLVDAFGPIFGMQADSSAMVAAEMEKQEALKKTVSAYDNYVKRIQDVASKEESIGQSIVQMFARSSEQVNTDLQKFAENVSVVGGTLRAYPEAYAAQMELFGNIVKQSSLTKQKIQEITDRIKILHDAMAQPVEARTGLAKGLDNSDIVRSISGLEAELEAQKTLLQGLQKEYDEAGKKLDDYNAAADRARKVATSATFKRQFMEVADANVRSILEIAAALKFTTSETAKAQEELNKIQKSADEIRSKNETNRTAEEAALLRRQRELTAYIADSEKAQIGYSNQIERALGLLGNASAQTKFIQQYMGATGDELENVLGLLQTADRESYLENLIVLREVEKQKTALQNEVRARELAVQSAIRSRADADTVRSLIAPLDAAKAALADITKAEDVQLATLRGIKGQWDANTSVARGFAAYEKQTGDQLRTSLDYIRRNDIGVAVKNANALAAAFINSKEALKAITNYVFFKGIAAQIEEGTKAMDAFYTKAKGALDNTYTEISALQEAFARFVADLRSSKMEISIDLKLQDKTNELDQKFKKYAADIEKKYDKLMRGATGSRKDYLEEQKKKELEMLEIRKKNETADLKRDSLQQQINAKLAQARQYMSDAANATTLDEAFALKDASKDSLRDAYKLILELQKVSKTDIFGKNLQQAVPSFEINKYVTAAKQVGDELATSFAEMNKGWEKQAREARSAYADSVKPIQEAFNAASNTVAQMKSVFPQLETLLTKLQNSQFPADLQAAATQYAVTFDNLQQRAAAGSLIKIDPQALNNDFKTFSDLAAKTFGDTLRDELSRQPLFGSGEYATEQLKGLFKGANVGIDWTKMKGEIEKDSANYPVTISAKVNAAAPAEGTSLNVPGAYTATSVAPAEGLPPLEGAYKITKFITDGVKVPTGGATGRARGGPVVGPGTGISDSILSWLSNGEYVIDSFTTRFFGSNFFKNLQTYARAGRRLLPGFAGGGPVLNTSSNLVGALAGSMDTVNLNLTLQGERVSLLGDRQQVKKMVNILKTMQAT